MTEPLKHAEEKVEELVHEAEEGKSARTPLLVLTGTTIFFGAAIAILLVITFSAYYLTK